jgi:hypothetical protein
LEETDEIKGETVNEVVIVSAGEQH